MVSCSVAQASCQLPPSGCCCDRKWYGPVPGEIGPVTGGHFARVLQPCGGGGCHPVLDILQYDANLDMGVLMGSFVYWGAVGGFVDVCWGFMCCVRACQCMLAGLRLDYLAFLSPPTTPHCMHRVARAVTLYAPCSMLISCTRSHVNNKNDVGLLARSVQGEQRPRKELCRARGPDVQ